MKICQSWNVLQKYHWFNKLSSVHWPSTHQGLAGTQVATALASHTTWGFQRARGLQVLRALSYKSASYRKRQNLELELIWSSQRLHAQYCGARSLDSRTCQPQPQHSSWRIQCGLKSLSWIHCRQSFQISCANAGSFGFLGVLVTQTAQTQKFTRKLLYDRHAFFWVMFKNMSRLWIPHNSVAQPECIWNRFKLPTSGIASNIAMLPLADHAANYHLPGCNLVYCITLMD